MTCAGARARASARVRARVYADSRSICFCSFAFIEFACGMSMVRTGHGYLSTQERNGAKRKRLTDNRAKLANARSRPERDLYRSLYHLHRPVARIALARLIATRNLIPSRENAVGEGSSRYTLRVNARLIRMLQTDSEE